MARKPRPAAKPTIGERSFQSAVFELARYKGWRIAHFHDSRRDVGGGVLVGDSDADGFPDAVMAHRLRGLLLFVEFKSEKGQPTAEQYEWGDDLCFIAETQGPFTYMASRFDYRFWKPSDWPEIEAML